MVVIIVDFIIKINYSMKIFKTNKYNLSQQNVKPQIKAKRKYIKKS